MLELGAQNLYDIEHYGWIAKDYFEAISIEHISVDIIEHQKCVYGDLRELQPYGGFDIVTNEGTLEHIDGSLYIPFKNIHNACVIDGIMIHENPMTGNWPGHGQHYFTNDFYVMLSTFMEYEILENKQEPAMGNITDGWNVSAVLRKVIDKPFIEEETFNQIYNEYIFSK